MSVVLCRVYVGDVRGLGGCNIEGEDDSWDFGTGAGFYVDATVEKWKSHYRMYTYVTKEVVGNVSLS